MSIVTTSQPKDSLRYFVLVFLVSCVFFWNDGISLELFNLYGADRFAWSTVSVVFVLVIVFIILGIFRPINITNNWYIKSLLWLMLIVLAPILLSSIRLYGQAWSAILRRPFFFGGYLIFPILILLRLSKKETLHFFWGLMILSLIASSLTCLVYFEPDLQDIFVKEMTWVRFGKLRVGGGRILPNLSMILFFVSIAGFIDASRGWLRIGAFFNAFVMFWMFFYVWKTRGIIFPLMVALIVIWLFQLELRNRMKVLFAVGFALICSLLFSILGGEFPVINPLKELYRLSIEEYTAYGGTIGSRIEAIGYYFTEFKRTCFVGVGLTSTTMNTENPVSMGLLYYRLNMNDIGIFGMIYKFGVPVIIFLFVMFRRLLRDLSELRSEGQEEVRIIASGIMFFLVFNIAGLFFTKAFFFPKFSLFYGLLLYFVWRLKQPDFVTDEKKGSILPLAETQRIRNQPMKKMQQEHSYFPYGRNA